jgi:hypothetical protein
LFFVVPSIAHDGLPDAVTYGALATVPHLTSDEILTTGKRSLESLNTVEYISSDRVSV